MKLVADVKVMANTLMIQTKYPVKLTDGKYEVDIKEVGKSKTTSQLRYLWALIDEISKKQNGNTEDSENIYLQLLDMSSAKTQYLAIKTEAIDDFKRLVKHFKVIESKDGKSLVKAYYGASEMNTSEMSKLIDTAVNYAQEVGIESSYWEALLNG